MHSHSPVTMLITEGYIMLEKTLTDGTPIYEGFDKLKENGQQQSYVVLSEYERSKGFRRKVRRSYTHEGLPAPIYPLRDLTEEEKEKCKDENYSKYEEYPQGGLILGKYWTLHELHKVERGGCGKVTTMGLALAETYARQPNFYGKTFCVTCKEHLPVSEFVWEGTNERVGS